MRTALDGAPYAGVLTQPATLLTTVAIDTSGSLIVNDGPVNESSMAFDTPVDLARILAGLPTTSTGFATKWLAFSTGAYSIKRTWSTWPAAPCPSR